MATKFKDAAVVTSKYKSNGSEKSRWTNVGALFQNDDGSMFLSLDAFFNFSALPRKEGSDRVIIGLFDPKQKDSSRDSHGYGYSNSDFSGTSADSNSGFSDNDDSDIPF